MAKGAGRSSRNVRDLCATFLEGVREIIGANLIAVYLHGAAAFPKARSDVGDIDLHVIVRKAITSPARRRIRGLHRDLAERYPRVGDDMDVWYITEKDARGRRPPRHQLNPSATDRSWALHRAHWLAGRYVLLHGAPPSEFCKPPSWPELERGLLHELRFVENLVRKHQAQAYCVLNLSRILYSLTSRNVVVSKPQAAQWALRHLPRRHGPLIRAARHAHAGNARAEDHAVLRENTRPFLTYARGRIHLLVARASDI